MKRTVTTIALVSIFVMMLFLVYDFFGSDLGGPCFPPEIGEHCPVISPLPPEP